MFKLRTHLLALEARFGRIALRIIAITLVLLLAGPEVFLVSEYLMMVELVGEAGFVFLYVTAAKLIWQNLGKGFTAFESRYYCYIPSSTLALKNPSLLYFAIPRRTLILAFSIAFSALVASQFISFQLLY